MQEISSPSKMTTYRIRKQIEPYFFTLANTFRVNFKKKKLSGENEADFCSNLKNPNETKKNSHIVEINMSQCNRHIYTLIYLFICVYLLQYDTFAT